MNLNFNSISETNYSSTSGKYLKPYDIYQVNLTKIEKTELKGKKDPSKIYPIVTLEFKEVGDSGKMFTDKLFIPVTEEDMERQVIKNNEGHENLRPSRFENYQYTLMQIVHAINPTGEEKIKNNASKIKTIDQFTDLIIKALSGKESVNVYLKLIGRKNDNVMYAALPSSCGLNKNKEIFATNFISSNKEDLFFSNYEETQKKLYQNAKPTDMTKITKDEKTDEDLDLDNIEV
jgi:hypothetical protein